jgi:hypothetical protein
MNKGLLTSPLKLIGLSEKFCNCAKIMGFSTLKSIIDCPTNELINKKGFSYGWLEELTSFLIENKLLALLQPIPGKNRD